MNSAATAWRESAILIVDDAPAHLDTLRTTMARQGYRTFVANSGERALGLAKQVHPDLILLDVMMPGMDGLETCRQLKLHPDTEHIPVIFMSARNEAHDVVAGFERGAVDYIGKPLRMAEVCARVRARLPGAAPRTAQPQASEQWEQSRRLRTMIDTMAEGLMIVQGNGQIDYTNPACDSYLGYGAGELAGHSITELLHAPVAADYLQYFSSCAADPARSDSHGTREVAIHHRDGVEREMDLTLTPMQVDGQALFIGQLHDISHRKQQQVALERAALADPLTRIANRRHFDNVVELEWQRAVRSGQPLSLIMLDVDHFKLYNDELGHAAGDSALRAVAAVLAAHAPRATDLAARYGGEEFALLFGETDANAACTMAESIRSAIEALQLPHPRSPSSAWLTASVGVITIIPSQLDLLADSVQAADRAMYAAKDAGRNRIVAVHAGPDSWEAVKLMSRH
ncbi:diguanylate cyclase [Massilia sp. CF038]|uniref:diguanylate cyclase n=1 Tax=Massilia sp. CF038 TaxID=1881045 RepID=UPI00091E1767|nr:diguanylate cyclase [Massilia sp. CF038]SHG58534.1 response regulator receiver modulated diguanylate cyclase [Massilia sp. CF038]